MYDFLFMVSIFDLIHSPGLEALCRLLGLHIKSEWLEKEYDTIERGQGNAYLFPSHEGCLFLDLFREPTDQHEMIQVGVRCKKELYASMKAALTAIHEKAPVKSARLNEGTGVLDKSVNAGNYPIERATITVINGKEAYRFHQKLIVFQTGPGNPA